jgi:hypothetical protein
MAGKFDDSIFDCTQKPTGAGWGEGPLGLEPISLSCANLGQANVFSEAWPDAEFVQQAVAQLPW